MGLPMQSLGLNGGRRKLLFIRSSLYLCSNRYKQMIFIFWNRLLFLKKILLILIFSREFAGNVTNKVNYDRLLTAVLDALCNPMIKLRNTFPITYSPETETRCKNFSPTENLSITTSMIQAGDLTSHQFPVLNELMNYRSHLDGVRFGSWTFRY